ncbi:response regulator [Roseicyclus sp.]|uniref:response regulator n=1 Tax=Roseicyclus sp. TaxID=1914329 RepID=UPI003F6BC744
MDDALIEIEYRPKPTADRPFLGLTVLVVEDSRYASEAVRLMCLRSGARIRRADCIGAAERHLHVYRPSIAIVDLGLPDGSGTDLIARMDKMRPRVPVLLGTSGADRASAQAEVMKAGGDGFLAKPIESLAHFQSTIMSHLPADICARMPRPVDFDAVEPDPITFREDLTHAIALLALEEPPLGYLRRFLLGVARSARDAALEGRATGIGDQLAATERRALSAFLSQRVKALAVVM